MFRHAFPRAVTALSAAAALVVACTGGSPSASPPSASSSPVSVVVTRAVAYESAPATGAALNAQGTLDVYAPTRPGSWPVVVMYHGDPANSGSGWMQPYAERVAALGFVVFAPNWGHSGGAAYDALSPAEWSRVDMSQAACAAAFAGEHAAEYGGDASRLILFGHSLGGNAALMAAFDPADPSPGCLAAGGVGTPSAVVVFEADWMLANPIWDAWFADQPEMYAIYTPWAHLDARPGIEVRLLASSAPGEGRSDGDWVNLRDPSGAMRSALDATGALDDGYVGLDEIQIAAARLLEDAGIDASAAVMPESTHMMLSAAGYQVFSDTFAALLE